MKIYPVEEVRLQILTNRQKSPLQSFFNFTLHNFRILRSLSGGGNKLTIKNEKFHVLKFSERDERKFQGKEVGSKIPTILQNCLCDIVSIFVFTILGVSSQREEFDDRN